MTDQPAQPGQWQTPDGREPQHGHLPLDPQGYGQGWQSQNGQPQYGQPQYGQPQDGQPRYGQPQYGHGQFGQPQYGQPQHGHPQHGGPQYGGPQYGGPQYGQQAFAPAPPTKPALLPAALPVGGQSFAMAFQPLERRAGRWFLAWAIAIGFFFGGQVVSVALLMPGFVDFFSSSTRRRRRTPRSRPMPSATSWARRSAWRA